MTRPRLPRADRPAPNRPPTVALSPPAPSSRHSRGGKSLPPFSLASSSQRRTPTSAVNLTASAPPVHSPPSVKGKLRPRCVSRHSIGGPAPLGLLPSALPLMRCPWKRWWVGGASDGSSESFELEGTGANWGARKGVEFGGGHHQGRGTHCRSSGVTLWEGKVLGCGLPTPVLEIPGGLGVGSGGQVLGGEGPRPVASQGQRLALPP